MTVITDVDDAFRQLISTAYFVTICEAFESSGVIPTKDISSLPSLFNNTLLSCNATDFDIDSKNFLKNDAIIKCNQIYDDFIKYLDSETRSAFKEYITEQLEINYHETLSEQYISFEKYAEYIKSNVYRLENRNSRLAMYKAELKNLYWQTIMQDEAGLRLADIYVEPGYNVHSMCLRDDDSVEINVNNLFVEMRDKQKNIHNLIHKILINDDILNLKVSNPKTTFILGFPGQGKTSLCKRLAHDVITRKIPIDKPVYYVQLRRLVASDLINAPLEAITKLLCKELSMDNIELSNSLLILDGLDEVYMQGAKASGIDDFCQKIAWQTKEMPNIKVLITSRFGYIDIEKLRNYSGVLILQIKELNKAQQKKWLRIYRSFHPKVKLTEEIIEQINKEKRYAHVRELIEQPILLYMIATANFDINDNSVNRARIYKELFDTLVERKWANKERIDVLRRIEATDLRKLIRAVALAIFQTGDSYISKKDLLNLRAFGKFNEKIGDGQQFSDSIKGVMIAFYLQETAPHTIQNIDSEYTVEFLHKSLQEYMAAEEIWEKIKEFGEQRINEEFFIDSYSKAMGVVTTLFSPRCLSYEIVNYLREVIKNDKIIDKRLLFDRMRKFLPELLTQDFFDSNMIIHNKGPFDLMLSGFYGYWTCLAALIPKEAEDATEAQFENSDWNYISSNILSRFLFWMKCLTAMPETIAIDLSHQSLIESNLVYSYLHEANLYRANLTYAELNDANLMNANLKQAILEETQMPYVDLINSNLCGANLSGSELNCAMLTNANLSNAIVTNANLSKAVLVSANLSNSDLSGVNFNKADLSDATLVGANLTDANLNCANLCEANFCNANLTGADLRGAMLDSVNWEGANLKATHFLRKQVGVLSGVNTSGIIWHDKNDETKRVRMESSKS